MKRLIKLTVIVLQLKRNNKRNVGLPGTVHLLFRGPSDYAASQNTNRGAKFATKAGGSKSRIHMTDKNNPPG